jgi:iron complex transport system substrate-binding protein
VFFLSACAQKHKQENRDQPIEFVKIEYSKMFGIAKFNGYSQLYFVNNSDTTWSLRNDDLKPNIKLAVLSSVFAGYIELLEKQDQIIAVDNYKYYCDSILNRFFIQNKVTEVGEEGQINLNKLLLSKPNVLISSSFLAQDKSLTKRLKNSGINVVYCDNFKEQNPLARAEWIKLFGFLLNCQTTADSLFNTIAVAYKEQISHISPNTKKPLVLTDALYSDVWNVPGGISYTAKLIEDANGFYVFSDKKDLFSYPLSFELVLKKAQYADIWIHVNQYKTRDELYKANNRYALLNVFKQSKIYNNNKRENKYGGNDFWEIGVVRPDLVLKDLISIFNNPNISDEKLYFYTHVD